MEGFIPAFKLGNRWRFKRSLLDAWMVEQSGTAGARDARIGDAEAEEAGGRLGDCLEDVLSDGPLRAGGHFVTHHASRGPPVGGHGVMERGQGGVGDFGDAVEAEGDADGADAAVDVELRPAYLKASLAKEFPEGGSARGRQAGDADLSAVSVAGEDEIERTSRWDGGRRSRRIGFVGHEDNGGVGLVRDGEAELGATVATSSRPARKMWSPPRSMRTY